MITLTPFVEGREKTSNRESEPLNVGSLLSIPPTPPRDEGNEAIQTRFGLTQLEKEDAYEKDRPLLTHRGGDARPPPLLLYRRSPPGSSLLLPPVRGVEEDPGLTDPDRDEDPAAKRRRGQLVPDLDGHRDGICTAQQGRQQVLEDRREASHGDEGGKAATVAEVNATFQKGISRNRRRFDRILMNSNSSTTVKRHRCLTSSL